MTSASLTRNLKHLANNAGKFRFYCGKFRYFI